MECGYDDRTGQKIYNPVPYDRINQAKDEMLDSISKYEHTHKDILQAILPYVAIIGAFVMIFGIAYLMTNGMITMSDTLNQIADKLDSMSLNLPSVSDGGVPQGGNAATPIETPKPGGDKVVKIVDG